MTQRSLQTEIAIIGAGLVGLAAAVSLHQLGFSVVLVDGNYPTDRPFFEDAWDQRIYAISPKNVQWLSQLGVWQLVNSARIGVMQGMEIFDDTSQIPLTLSAEDANAANLGFIVESSALMEALLHQVNILGIHTMFGMTCESLDTFPRKTILHFTNHDSLDCSLLLAADGSHSWVRQQLKIPNFLKSYEQAAIVANFKIEKSHGNIARQWISNDNEGFISILAWLPLPDNMISIVWSLSIQQANALLSSNPDAFTSKVLASGSNILGELTLMGSVSSYPLNLQSPQTVVQDSAVLVGDAAHQIHPMAGQGVNLGFRDIIDLVESLKLKNQYQSINDNRLLQSYNRARKADALNMVILTDGLFQLYARQSKVIKKFRGWGLSVAKRQGMKRILVASAIAL